MLARIVLTAALVLTVAACSTSPQQIRLVDTKGPVQLLRNEAWFRLPALMVKGDSDTTDVSVACKGAESGRLRYWTSSTIALLNNSFAPRAVVLADDLATSFEQQGWAVERDEAGVATVTTLTRPESFAVIEIEARTKTTEHRASVRITTSGPCVETDGADSAEVRLLEDSVR